MNDASVRWVSSADPLLQLFPATITLTTTGFGVYDVPTTFAGSSQFGSTVTEVHAISVLSSFYVVTSDSSYYLMNAAIAVCNGSAWDWPQNLAQSITQKTAFYSANSPFFVSGGNKVKIIAHGFAGSVVYATLVFTAIDASHTAVSRAQLLMD